jgi:uncharacterized protein (DUF433 family)
MQRPEHVPEVVMSTQTAAQFATVETVPLQMDDDGVVRVGNTRVTLDTIVSGFLEGATAEELAQQYPSVQLADIYSVIGYYLRQRSEVEAYLEQRRRHAVSVQQENESRLDPTGIRERLEARRAKGRL